MTVTTFSHYNAPAEDSQQAAPANSTYVHGGAVRYSEGQGEVSVQTQRYSHSSAGVSGASIMSTLDRYGHKTVEMEPGNPASRTSLAVAVRAGVLRVNAAGQYEDATGGPATEPQASSAQAAEQPQQATQADHSDGSFDTSEWQGFEQTITPLPQHVYDGAVAKMVAMHTVSEHNFADVARVVARDSGMEPEQAHTIVQQGYATYENALARYLTPLGITGGRKEAFYQWARSTKNNGPLQDAMQKMIHGRDMRGWLPMAAEFNRHN